MVSAPAWPPTRVASSSPAAAPPAAPSSRYNKRMISKLAKFPMRTGFLAFRAGAKQLATPHLRLLYVGHTPSRLSVVVPAKVSKLASTRATLRRLTYDHMWKVIKEKNLDCVIIFKPLALVVDEKTQKTILTELKELRV